MDQGSSANHHTFLILKRFVVLQETRVRLVKEFEAALQSSLSNSDFDNAQGPGSQEVVHNGTIHEPEDEHSSGPSDAAPVSACRHEYEGVESNPDDYVQQVITISTSGLLEIKDEIKLLVQLLEVDLKRPELVCLLNRIEDLETTKMAELSTSRRIQCLQRDLVRRRSTLEQREFSETIDVHEAKVTSLTGTIVELMTEVQAELAELS